MMRRPPTLAPNGLPRIRMATNSSKQSAKDMAKPKARTRGDERESFWGFLKRNSGIIFFGSACCVTAYLAAWQTQRYFWKKELIVSRATLVNNPAVPLLEAVVGDQDPATLERMQYTPVVVGGKLDVAHTVFVGPRSKPSTGDTSNQPKSGLFSTGNGGNGVHVLTPLIIDNPDLPMVAVDRGWIPKNAIEEFKKQDLEREVPECTVYSGVLMKGEQLNLPGFPDTSPDSDQYLYRDLSTLATYAKIETDAPFTTHFYVAALPRGPDPELVQKNEEGYVDFTIEPETHAGYAATWGLLTFFGMAIARQRFFR